MRKWKRRAWIYLAAVIAMIAVTAVNFFAVQTFSVNRTLTGSETTRLTWYSIGVLLGSVEICIFAGLLVLDGRVKK